MISVRRQQFSRRHHDPLFVSSDRTFDEFLLSFADLRKYADPLQVGGRPNRQEDAASRCYLEAEPNFSDRDVQLDDGCAFVVQVRGLMTAADLARHGTLHRC